MPGDAQSLSLPYYAAHYIAIMITAINDPGSSLATWASIIPVYIACGDDGAVYHLAYRIPCRIAITLQ